MHQVEAIWHASSQVGHQQFHCFFRGKAIFVGSLPEAVNRNASAKTEDSHANSIKIKLHRGRHREGSAAVLYQYPLSLRY